MNQLTKQWVLVLTAVVAMFTSCLALGHESRPLLIEVNERENNIVVTRWRTPNSVPLFNVPTVVLRGCQSNTPTSATVGYSSQSLATCTSLDNVSIEITFPLANPSISTLVRVTRLNGESHSVLAGPDEMLITLPAASTTGNVLREYFILGVEHILLGYDHLLFVACLVLIAGTLRRILITVTGFTLAHSITLAAAALGWVRIPVPPVEAVIALSIVFLATELSRTRRDTLTWRHPIAVSASFGLLHGFGFASVLDQIGLPQVEVPAALAAFNIGVEAGQVAFVLTLAGLFAIGRKVWQATANVEASATVARRLLERPVGYLVGVPAAFWTLDRVIGFF